MPYRRLEYAPRSPFHDIQGTVNKIRAQYPGISDMGVNQAVKRMLTGYKPRHKGLVVHLYGADILSENLPGIPAWQWVSEGERVRLLDHPIDRGERIPNDIEPQVVRVLQEELANRLNRKAVHRSVLISPPGLQQTYVWRQDNAWIQEVRDADYDLILAVPGNRRLFRDPDIHGPYVAVRSYDTPGEVIGIAHNGREADYLIRSTQRRPQWSSAKPGDS